MASASPSHSLALLLRRQRQAAGLTQEDLAALARLSWRTVSDLERGAALRPHRDTVALLADALALTGAARAAFEAAARRPPPPSVETPHVRHAAASPDPYSGASWTTTLPGGLPILAPPPARLVGRAREQARLRQALASALAGRGRLVLIGGAAGMGKTALAEDLLQEAQAQGARVLVGRCYDLAETPPYGPWREALAGLPTPAPLPMPVDPVYPAPAAGITSQSALFAHVQSVLQAATHDQALVLLLDDLHWADPASLDLLRDASRGLVALPIVVLVTYRDDELTRRHPLFQALPALVRGGPVERIDLRGLGADDVRTWVRERYRLPEGEAARLGAYLHRRAEGNAFFVEEVLRTLEGDGHLLPTEQEWVLGALTEVRVPPLLRQVIEGRLARLGDEARRVLEVAAVIGHEVPLAPWAMVATATDDTLSPLLEQAVEARLLEGSTDGMQVRFGHALIREVLYESIPALRRQSWHRRVGEALTAQRPAPDPDAVAYQFQRASDRRAADWLIRAGERAQRAYAWLSAAARFEAALALLDVPDAAGRRGWLLFRLALLRRLQDPQSGLAYLEEAERLGQAQGDQALVAVTVFNRGLIRCMAGDVWHGLPELETGVQALAALCPADRVRVRALDRWGDALDGANGQGELTLWLAEVGRYAEARALGERLVAARSTTPGEDGITDDSLGDAYYGLAWSYAALGEPYEARRVFARARAAFRATDHRFMLASSLWYELRLVVLPYLADRLVERQRLAAEATQASEQIQAATSFPPRYSLIDLLLLEGQWTEARTLLLAVASTASSRPFDAHPLGRLAWQQGDRDLAWARVRAAYPLGPDTPPGAVPSYAVDLQRLAARLALDEGDRALARQWLVAHDHWLEWSGSVLGRAEAQLGFRAAYYRAASDTTQARACATAALACATTPRQPLALLAAHRLLGELETAETRWTVAETHLEAALALAEACAAPYEQALTLLALAELRQARGDRPTAQTLLEAVRTLCEPLGAQPVLARVDALSAQLSVTHAAHVGAPDGLTPREVEVLRLLAGGLSNASIAERLVVSPRTVNAHLTTIYGKLGVSSRSAAVVFAIDYGLR